MKKTLAVLLAAAMALTVLAGCSATTTQPTGASGETKPSTAANGTKPATAPNGTKPSEATPVTLKIWAPQEDQADANSWLPQMEARFEAAHPEYKMTWINEVGGEDVAKNNVTKDPAAAADVYMYANDMLGDLIACNGLAKLGGSYLEQVRADNSKTLVDTVTAPDGSVYGFPYANNTWFLYYNKDVYTEEDVKSLETMLSKGVVAFPTKNSWYLGAFFFANGAEIFGPNGVEADKGVTFGEDNGAAALNAILEMVASPNYRTDDAGLGNSGLKSGDVAAYFSGAWDYAGLKEALGDKLGAAQLPTAMIGGSAKQLKSFAGSKAVGVNPNSANQKVAMQFAAFMASTEGQKLHYDLRGIVPTIASLANDSTVASDMVAVATINTMTNTSVAQPSIQEMSNWWTPIETLGNNIVNGNVTAENVEQTLTDTLAGINSTGL